MPTLLSTWTTPFDPGGGNPSREYHSPALPAGWANLRIECTWVVGWSGYFRISGETSNWFNRFPQPASPFLAVDPQAAYVTKASDTMLVGVNNSTPGFQATISLFGDPPVQQAFCEFGTELKQAGTALIYLTPELILAICTAAGVPEASILFTPLWFSTIDARAVCGQGPPTVAPLTPGTLEAQIDVVKTYLYALAWPYLCQCTPGPTTPTPYPPPGLTIPPGWPTPPVFACSDIDVCATLVTIQQQLASLAAAVSRDLELDTLSQRYRLPFATVPGATHQGLTLKGSFAVPRLRGVRVSIRQRPSRLELPGPTPYVFDLGWVAVSGAGAVFMEERRVSQDAFDWYPADMQMATTFGYEFFPGVVADVQELAAET